MSIIKTINLVLYYNDTKQLLKLNVIDNYTQPVYHEIKLNYFLMKHIIITGGSGFVGSSLVSSLQQKDPQIAKIFILTRDKSCAAKKSRFDDDKVEYAESLDHFQDSAKIDIIINLAGEPIADKRWGNEQKTRLRQSRINTTRDVIQLIARLKTKPQTLISASAIGYYGSQDPDEQLDEDSKPHEEFTHFLCKDWENEAKKAEKYGVRVCLTRFGVILGKNGGALKKMLTPFKFGLGGKIASGGQMMSWIHLTDVVRAITFLINNEDCNGEYNLCAPNAVSNKKFTKSLSAALHRPAFFDMPLVMVKILFGEMGETLLAKGQNVYPRKLLDEGFNFRYRRIDAALKNIVD